LECRCTLPSRLFLLFCFVGVHSRAGGQPRPTPHPTAMWGSSHSPLLGRRRALRSRGVSHPDPSQRPRLAVARTRRGPSLPGDPSPPPSPQLTPSTLGNGEDRPDVNVHARSMLLQGLLVSGPEKWPGPIEGVDPVAVVTVLESLTKEFGLENRCALGAAASLSDLFLYWWGIWGRDRDGGGESLVPPVGRGCLS
jgi:hypothetical protein